MTRKTRSSSKAFQRANSAYVPELPTILVTGRSVEELTARAAEAIRLYWGEHTPYPSPTSTFREIELELPA
jgi:predicted RNase H-like HicB family nuclease